jgi:branched-chain amino acid aminotransferase
MKDFTGNFCVIDGKVVKTDALNGISLSALSVCYEVIRVDEEIFLFLEDHLRRFRDSVQHIRSNYNIDFKYIIDALLKLKNNNDLQSGNIRLLIAFHPRSERDPLFIAFQALHQYPTENQYREGIKTSLFRKERERPNIKYLNTPLQEKCRNEIINRNVYEVLLVDHNGYLTEGSKSNIFFIRGNSLYTSPAQRVLKGITREKIIEICRESGFPLIEENISVNSLNQYKAAFLSGTSPKILPVAFIDKLSLSVEDPLMSKVKARYEALIGTYKTKIRQTGYRFDSL